MEALSEPVKQQMGDGQDNYGQAMRQMASATKQISKNIAQQAAGKGTAVATNAATAVVKAGAATGKAVANIAAGTAAGGPFGAIISAAWSMRHTLFKVLISICLVVLFVAITVISLPAIIFDSIFGLSGDYSGSSLQAAYSELSTSVTQTISKGYRFALDKVDSIIKDGGYDYDRSMSALVDNSNIDGNYDVCYAISVYSASKQQKDVSADNMVYMMTSAIDQMFVVTYEVLRVEVPILSDLLEIIGTEIISFVKCVIQPFTNAFFLTAFGVNVNAKYGEFDITYGEAIDFMADALRQTLQGESEFYKSEGA